MHRRPALAAVGVAFALSGASAGSRAAVVGYTEAHETGDEVRIRLDGAGRAHVEHTFAWRVLAGQKRSFDIVGVEPNAVPDAQASIVGEDERETTAQVSVRSSSTVPSFTVTMDDPKALRRGRYKVRVAYDVDWVASHAITRDGSMWRVMWTAPVATEGYDEARVVLDAPGAATEPRVVRNDSDGPDESVLSNVGHEAGRDRIEMTRPHVAKGDAPVWSVLLAPQALPELRMPEAPKPAAPSVPIPPRHVVSALAALVAIGVAFGALVRTKDRTFREACAAVKVVPRAIVPLPGWLRASIGGTALATGIGMQLRGAAFSGSLLVALSMLVAVVVATPSPERARGPGHWLALRPEEALAAPDRARGCAWLDAGTRAGKLALFAVVAVVAACAVWLQRAVIASPYLPALDALAVVPLFATGRRTELPATAALLGRMLAPLFAKLRKNHALRVAPWARVPVGAAEADEVRLLVTPRAAMAGVLGIEVGIAEGRSAREYAHVPEVLVRVQEASAAQARMTALVPRLVPFPGRKPDERVYRIAPRYPTAGFTRGLVERLARELVDKRKSDEGPRRERAERRVPPAERVARAQAQGQKRAA